MHPLFADHDRACDCRHCAHSGRGVGLEPTSHQIGVSQRLPPLTRRTVPAVGRRGVEPRPASRRRAYSPVVGHPTARPAAEHRPAERHVGIGPTTPVWKTGVIPLHQWRVAGGRESDSPGYSLHSSELGLCHRSGGRRPLHSTPGECPRLRLSGFLGIPLACLFSKIGGSEC